ncbi:TRAP transporter small permease subunit [Tranquillimonas alkanivorans]|uniref:TRAP transporter small permease protein n=1 Tax=Tranquillimonas alkanivorans TaxID=441119 RepID=A0A1I5NQ08_9RHOB|nr:TRAP transporter small permease [Tranquillimonas alkanivorans]SFP23812.1 TRAP-type mannitol/chloroaromatic compound transport system, small permease component [Tranquillimonas alkanivorans]
MSTYPTDSTDAPRLGHRTRGGQIARAWVRLVDGLCALGTVLIGVLMFIISADVVARNLLGSSLPLVSELGALTLVMIVYLQLAATVRHDRLARTDLFFTPFKLKRPRAGALLGAAFDAVAAAALGMLAWSTVDIIEKDFTRGEYIGVTGIATLPTWPFRVLIFTGIAVAAIQCVIQVIAALRAPGEKKGADA